MKDEDYNAVPWYHSEPDCPDVSESKLNGGLTDESCCSWDLEDDYLGQDTTYDTDCNKTFMFNNGNCKENNFIYCPYCGKKISC